MELAVCLRAVMNIERRISSSRLPVYLRAYGCKYLTYGQRSRLNRAYYRSLRSRSIRGTSVMEAGKKLWNTLTMRDFMQRKRETRRPEEFYIIGHLRP